MSWFDNFSSNQEGRICPYVDSSSVKSRVNTAIYWTYTHETLNLVLYMMDRGYAEAQFIEELRATSQKVTGSILDGVIGIFLT